MSSQTKAEVMQTLIGMIAEVLGEDGFGITESTSFREELEFQSIQFVALAELIQEHWADINFVSWLTAKELADVFALRVGDVADFIVASSTEP